MSDKYINDMIAYEMESGRGFYEQSRREIMQTRQRALARVSAEYYSMARVLMGLVEADYCYG